MQHPGNSEKKGKGDSTTACTQEAFLTAELGRGTWLVKQIDHIPTKDM